MRFYVFQTKDELPNYLFGIILEEMESLPHKWIFSPRPMPYSGFYHLFPTEALESFPYFLFGQRLFY